MLIVLAMLVIAAAVWAIFRGMDVRLALMSAAVIIACIVGDLRPIVREFLSTFSNEKFVVPICTAMGFAYVLRHTQCDQHLVHLLTNPLQRARGLLIPGVVCVGFLVNVPVISQTSTAVCIGAVVVPLMRTAGISSATIGASILLGASLGGELLNPGAPELNTVAESYKPIEGQKPVSPQDVVPAVSRLVFYHLAIAIAIFWWLSLRHERAIRAVAPEPMKPQAEFRVNYLRAFVPIIPLVLLFATGPPLNLLNVPVEWVAEEKAKSAYGTRLIGLAMLIGVVVALAASPRQAGGVPRAFFEGAGYGFAAIISIIVTANCFGASIKQIGLADRLAEVIKAAPNLLIPLAAGVPLAFAALSGSGMASTQSVFAFFVKPAEDAGLSRLDLGALVSIGAAAGRTMSPVAAVTLMSATMTQSNPFTLAKRVAVPLLISWAIVVGLRMMGLI